ncbi:SusC/RagA family TonB-linked outer membrane protein [Sunxiuqinia sp. A32]|uniref:SusC/RagA family TonB-linked outer membrane protein n=1 Tax=Sunxiuqinia sp. A32 TaxID=3461496 RepID=UPI004045A263
MKKTECIPLYVDFKKLVRIMKLATVLVFILSMNVFASTYGQTGKISIEMNSTFKEVIERLEQVSGYHFVLKYDELILDKVVNVKYSNESIENVLDGLLKETGHTYKIVDRYIAISPGEKQGKNSQQKGVSGKVSDPNGSPLPGVTVVVKGTTNGTISDFDGNYTINNIPDDAVLVFSFVGMKSQEVLVIGKSYIDIAMTEDAIGIGEVVAIGYGSVKREELTNAVSSVSSEDFVQGSIKDAAQLIKGQVAGVNIINPDANPTGTSQIVLRGVTTLAAGTQPLIVIDGVPGSLTDVAPEDIETIDVLKDGSAAAIYGTRGTNGVILITTKKVKGETPATIELNSYITTQAISKSIDFMNADQYRNLVNQGKPGAIDYDANTKWTDQIFRTPISQNHNISMKGGSSTTNYVMNINYKQLQGLMLRSDNNVLTARIEANHTMFDGKLKLNGNIIGYDQKYFSGGDGYSWRGDVYRNALIYNPTDPVKDEEGNWTEHPEMNNYANPLSLIRETEGEIAITNFKPFGTITFYPLDGLIVKALGSREIYNRTAGYSESFEHLNSIREARTGFASRSTSRNVNDLLELTSTYSKSFDTHNVNVLAGYSFQQDTYDFYWMNNFDFPSDKYTYNNMSDGAALTEGRAGMDSNKSSSKLVSYFARVNYSFNNKYLLMASLRYEGSSKFGKDHKWGAFPAVSAGWNIVNEEFMKNLGSSVSQLKMRVGYGITGTAPSSEYQSLSRLTYGNKYMLNGAWIPVIYPSSNANPDLRWETKEEINIGLDFGFFNNRISGAIDAYKRTTKDLLWNYNVSTPPYLYSSVLANAGSMENKGLEIQVTAIPVKTKNISWTTNLNYSTNSNKLLSLSNDKFQLQSGYFYTGWTEEPIQTNTHRVEESEAIGNFYGFKSIDIDEDGYWIIEGNDGNPKPIAEQQPDDKKVLGNGLPKHYLGWNNTFTYKQFDLNITMRGAFDYQILNMTKMFYAVPVSLTRGNVMTGTYDNIYGKRPLNDFQELQYVSHFIEEGDYWKIDNITLGYTFNLQRGIVKNLRLYLSGSNMFTISGYSGIDPEVNSIGLDPGLDNRDRYPSTRTFTFGFSMKF